MDLLQRNDLEQLAGRRAAPCVSLFIPTFRMGPDTSQNPIRWKNLLSRTDRALCIDGVGRGQIDALLRPARALSADRMFWEYQSDGLAMFAEPGWARTLQLPIDLPEWAAVGDRFALAPLLEMLTANGRFLLLALSQRQIRLFEGTRSAIDEIMLPDMPTPPLDANRDTRDRPGMFLADKGGSGTAAVYFGSGSDASDQRVEENLRYLRAVDRALRQVVRDGEPPLVLAGVGSLLSEYRQVSTYPGVVEDAVTGSPEESTASELHTRAWPLIEPVLRRSEDAARARYRELAGTGRTTHDPQAVHAAALQGRVDTLFVRLGVFGQPATHAVPVTRLGHGPQSVPDQIDDAATQALLHGAAVYVVPPQRMPETSDVAATLRY